jgi:acetyl esterase/lipase
MCVLLCCSQQLAAQQAGTLISAEPVAALAPGESAWRVKYITTDADHHRLTVSGMVVAPRGTTPHPRNVIAWAHGTWGVATKCAPSLSPRFFAATPALATMVSQGYVVVAPDFPGLGSTPPHPYLVGADTGRSVLDAVRAARSIAAAHAGARFAVWGESQGGHAALWTAAIARNYAPDLYLVGTAAAAPPADLVANFRDGSDLNVQAMLAAFATYSWSRHYAVPLTTAFGKVDSGIVRRLAENNCIQLDKRPRLGTILGIAAIKRSLKSKDITRIEPWMGYMRTNSVNAARIPGPLLIAQSVADPVVAPRVTKAFAERVCRARRPVRYIDLPGGDHGHTALNSATATLSWIAGRFKGDVPQNDCAKL